VPGARRERAAVAPCARVNWLKGSCGYVRQLGERAPTATTATPEIRVDVPEERKFDLVARAVAHFSSRYPVNTIDGVRITFPDGWGLLRASNTQPILVLRFEASDQRSLDAARREVVDWLAGQGVRA